MLFNNWDQFVNFNKLIHFVFPLPIDQLHNLVFQKLLLTLHSCSNQQLFVASFVSPHMHQSLQINLHPLVKGRIHCLQILYDRRLRVFILSEHHSEARIAHDDQHLIECLRPLLVLL